MQNISCCPDLMSENTRKITFHEYLRVCDKGKSSCRTENKLCMFIFTIQLAMISAAINDFIMEAARKKAADYFKHCHVVGGFLVSVLNDSLGDFSLSLCCYCFFLHYYSWSVSCFGVQSCLGFCLLVLQRHGLFSVLILFCCCSCFHLSCFLFNFESSSSCLASGLCVCPITSTCRPHRPRCQILVYNFSLDVSLFILFSHWFLCSPDYLVWTISCFVFILASALLVSQLFYWALPEPTLNVGGLWIHLRANLQFLYKHIKCLNLPWLWVWGTDSQIYSFYNIAANTLLDSFGGL